MKHGKGTETWTDGQSYNGSYVNDAKDGFGTYVWPSGSTYSGYWSQNLINGIVISLISQLSRACNSGLTGASMKASSKTT